MNAPRRARDVDVTLLEYLVVVVPDEVAAAVVFEAALELARNGVVTLLDDALVTVGSDGVVHIGDMSQVVESEPGPLWPGLLSEHDIELIASAIPADLFALILVIEDRWAATLSARARSVGG
jgi:hypothetical protein